MAYGLKELATLEIPAKPLVREGSFGSISIGSHASTMTLYEERGEPDDAPITFIEWDFPDLEETENVGLELDGEKHIVGYDGVCSFPRPAIPWLKSLGYTFAEDVE